MAIPHLRGLIRQFADKARGGGGAGKGGAGKGGAGGGGGAPTGAGEEDTAAAAEKYLERIQHGGKREARPAEKKLTEEMRRAKERKELIEEGDEALKVHQWDEAIRIFRGLGTETARLAHAYWGKGDYTNALGIAAQLSPAGEYGLWWMLHDPFSRPATARYLIQNPAFIEKLKAGMKEVGINHAEVDKALQEFRRPKGAVEQPLPAAPKPPQSAAAREIAELVREGAVSKIVPYLFGPATENAALRALAGKDPRLIAEVARVARMPLGELEANINRAAAPHVAARPPAAAPKPPAAKPAPAAPAAKPLPARPPEKPLAKPLPAAPPKPAPIARPEKIMPVTKAPPMPPAQPPAPPSIAYSDALNAIRRGDAKLFADVFKKARTRRAALFVLMRLKSPLNDRFVEEVSRLVGMKSPEEFRRIVSSETIAIKKGVELRQAGFAVRVLPRLIREWRNTRLVREWPNKTKKNKMVNFDAIVNYLKTPYTKPAALHALAEAEPALVERLAKPAGYASAAQLGMDIAREKGRRIEVGGRRMEVGGEVFEIPVIHEAPPKPAAAAEEAAAKKLKRGYAKPAFKKGPELKKELRITLPNLVMAIEKGDVRFFANIFANTRARRLAVLALMRYSRVKPPNPPRPVPEKFMNAVSERLGVTPTTFRSVVDAEVAEIKKKIQKTRTEAARKLTEAETKARLNAERAEAERVANAQLARKAEATKERLRREMEKKAKKEAEDKQKQFETSEFEKHLMGVTSAEAGIVMVRNTLHQGGRNLVARVFLKTKELAVKEYVIRGLWQVPKERAALIDELAAESGKDLKTIRKEFSTAEETLKNADKRAAWKAKARLASPKPTFAEWVRGVVSARGDALRAATRLADVRIRGRVGDVAARLRAGKPAAEKEALPPAKVRKPPVIGVEVKKPVAKPGVAAEIATEAAEKERELLERKARSLVNKGKFAEAAKWFEAIGKSEEAITCYERAGKYDLAVELALSKVSARIGILWENEAARPHILERIRENPERVRQLKGVLKDLDYTNPSELVDRVLAEYQRAISKAPERLEKEAAGEVAEAMKREAVAGRPPAEVPAEGVAAPKPTPPEAAPEKKAAERAPPEKPAPPAVPEAAAPVVAKPAMAEAKSPAEEMPAQPSEIRVEVVVKLPAWLARIAEAAAEKPAAGIAAAAKPAEKAEKKIEKRLYEKPTVIGATLTGFINAGDAKSARVFADAFAGKGLEKSEDKHALRVLAAEAFMQNKAAVTDFFVAKVAERLKTTPEEFRDSMKREIAEIVWREEFEKYERLGDETMRWLSAVSREGEVLEFSRILARGDYKLLAQFDSVYHYPIIEAIEAAGRDAERHIESYAEALASYIVEPIADTRARLISDLSDAREVREIVEAKKVKAAEITEAAKEPAAKEARALDEFFGKEGEKAGAKAEAPPAAAEVAAPAPEAAPEAEEKPAAEAEKAKAAKEPAAEAERRPEAERAEAPPGAAAEEKPKTGKWREFWKKFKRKKAPAEAAEAPAAEGEAAKAKAEKPGAKLRREPEPLKAVKNLKLVSSQINFLAGKEVPEEKFPRKLRKFLGNPEMIIAENFASQNLIMDAAAELYSKAEQSGEIEKKLLSGEIEKMAKKSKDPIIAARLFELVGKAEDAARKYLKGGDPVEAKKCLRARSSENAWLWAKINETKGELLQAAKDYNLAGKNREVKRLRNTLVKIGDFKNAAEVDGLLKDKYHEALMRKEDGKYEAAFKIFIGMKRRGEKHANNIIKYLIEHKRYEGITDPLTQERYAGAADLLELWAGMPRVKSRQASELYSRAASCMVELAKPEKAAEFYGKAGKAEDAIKYYNMAAESSFGMHEAAAKLLKGQKGKSREAAEQYEYEGIDAFNKEEFLRAKLSLETLSEDERKGVKEQLAESSKRRCAMFKEAASLYEKDKRTRINAAECYAMAGKILEAHGLCVPKEKETKAKGKESKWRALFRRKPLEGEEGTRKSVWNLIEKLPGGEARGPYRAIAGKHSALRWAYANSLINDPKFSSANPRIVEELRAKFEISQPVSMDEVHTKAAEQEEHLGNAARAATFYLQVNDITKIKRGEQLIEGLIDKKAFAEAARALERAYNTWESECKKALEKAYSESMEPKMPAVSPDVAEKWLLKAADAYADGHHHNQVRNVLKRYSEIVEHDYEIREQYLAGMREKADAMADGPEKDAENKKIENYGQEISAEKKRMLSYLTEYEAYLQETTAEFSKAAVGYAQVGNIDQAMECVEKIERMEDYAAIDGMVMNVEELISTADTDERINLGTFMDQIMPKFAKFLLNSRKYKEAAREYAWAGKIKDVIEAAKRAEGGNHLFEAVKCREKAAELYGSKDWPGDMELYGSKDRPDAMRKQHSLAGKLAERAGLLNIADFNYAEATDKMARANVLLEKANRGCTLDRPRKKVMGAGILESALGDANEHLGSLVVVLSSDVSAKEKYSRQLAELKKDPKGKERDIEVIESEIKHLTNSIDSWNKQIKSIKYLISYYESRDEGYEYLPKYIIFNAEERIGFLTKAGKLFAGVGDHKKSADATRQAGILMKRTPQPEGWEERISEAMREYQKIAEKNPKKAAEGITMCYEILAVMDKGWEAQISEAMCEYEKMAKENPKEAVEGYAMCHELLENYDKAAGLRALLSEVKKTGEIPKEFLPEAIPEESQ